MEQRKGRIHRGVATWLAEQREGRIHRGVATWLSELYNLEIKMWPSQPFFTSALQLMRSPADRTRPLRALWGP